MISPDKNMSSISKNDQADIDASYLALEMAFKPIALMFIIISAACVGGAFGAMLTTGLSLFLSKVSALVLGAQLYATASQPNYIIAYAMIGCVIGAIAALLMSWHLRHQLWRK